jgi:hypothetical protein
VVVAEVLGGSLRRLGLVGAALRGPKTGDRLCQLAELRDEDEGLPRLLALHDVGGPRSTEEARRPAPAAEGVGDGRAAPWRLCRGRRRPALRGSRPTAVAPP